jgi:Putative prokaryotic signal transducing protein
MIIVYSAANNLEAHMIKGVLEQQEIPAYIQGEHLQSGAGELPAISGYVKISVDDINRDAARKIIKDWEAKDQSLTENKPISIDQLAKSGSSFLYIISSFLIGAICMHLYLKPTISQNSLDYNKDGIDDEKWTYEGNIAIKSEHDRNLDGKYDDFWLYKNGSRLLHKLDNNFDGKFDTEDHFENDNIYYGKSDLNFDGEIDTTVDYESDYGNYKTSIFNPKTKLIKKIQYYKSDRLVSSELDKNDDGKMDYVIEYDAFEEEIRRKPITSE